MNNLSKDAFISAIESLQLQVSKDIDNSNTISKVFDTDAVYDNSVLVKAVIKLLQVFFPKDENGFCEIEHYCFDMNFGKVSDQELITPEDLWDRLAYKLLIQDAECIFKPSAFFVDESGIWHKECWPKLKGVLGTIRSEPIPSTHPLIDDYPKQVTILDFITKEKEEALETIKQNSLYSICYANQLFLEGKISALESIEKELKIKQ